MLRGKLQKNVICVRICNFSEILKSNPLILTIVNLYTIRLNSLCIATPSTSYRVATVSFFSSIAFSSHPLPPPLPPTFFYSCCSNCRNHLFHYSYTYQLYNTSILVCNDLFLIISLPSYAS